MTYLVKRLWAPLAVLAFLVAGGCATGQGDDNLLNHPPGSVSDAGSDVGGTDGSATDDQPVTAQDAQGMNDGTVIPGPDVPVAGMDGGGVTDTGSVGVDVVPPGMDVGTDAGVVDTGVDSPTDSGIVTVPDVGFMDTGTGVDAGFPDAGVPDDTGVPVDTGVPDDTGTPGLVCPSGLGTTTCTGARNCCLGTAFGVGLGCGCSPLPGVFPCLPVSSC